jgi:hypothetical protein
MSKQLVGEENSTYGLNILNGLHGMSDRPLVEKGGDRDKTTHSG